MRPRSFGFLLLAVSLSGCALMGDESDTVDADNLPQLVLEEELRIGSLDDPDVGFSRIGAVEVAEDGTVFVLESQDRQVRVYDSAGQLLRRIGGRGQGPGELQNPFALQLVGDTVAVTELTGNARITLYARDGTLVRTISSRGFSARFDNVRGFEMLLRPSRLLPDGRIEAVTTGMVVTNGLSPANPDSVLVPRVVFDATGERADTVGFYSSPVPRALTAGGATIPRPNFLSATDLRSTFESDTLLVNRPVAADAAEGAFTVTRLSAGGDTVFHRQLRYTPRAVDAAYRDSVISGRVAGYVNRPGVDVNALRSAIESAAQWPAFHPPVGSLRIGSDGSVWLRREDTDSIPRWTVLDTDGNPRGEALIPETTTVEWSDRETLWAVVLDQFDVPWLVRYRISGG